MTIDRNCHQIKFDFKLSLVSGRCRIISSIDSYAEIFMCLGGGIKSVRSGNADGAGITVLELSLVATEVDQVD